MTMGPSRVRVGIVLLFLGLLTGCQTTTSYYRGASAEEMNTVALAADQVGEQSWQDLYLRVDYSLERTAGQLTIAGEFTYTQTTRTVYQLVHDLKLKLYLLDAEMRVIDYRQIARSLGTGLESRTPFREQFDLSEEVTAFTFGYDGVLIDDEKGAEMIWKVPQRDP
jgi:hypothetical protein